MPLAFLTPLFLGGLALLAAPYLIHQIRRPERETTRFSSLMFIPKERKEVIERRRLQHILLMLIRMTMLTLLALAFARPYWRTPASAVAATPGAAWHAVLLDASYSMGAGDWFEKARAQGRSIVNSLAPADRVGVIVFADSPRVASPLLSEDDPEAGTAASARQAIESAPLAEEATAYVPALQAAQSMFSAAEARSAGSPARYVVHLISDFQRAGLPEKSDRWKLAPGIELHCVEIGKPDVANFAIEDISIREIGSDRVRVLGKIRNWSNAGKAPRTVKLVAEGREPLETTLTVEPGAARQVAFQLPVAADADLEGRLELESDSLEIDNRRYFARKARGQQRVMLLSKSDSDRDRPAERFLSSALPPEGDLPWRLEIREPDEARAVLLNEEERPFILLAGGLDNAGAGVLEAIRRYVETGGRVLLTIDATAASDSLNEALLKHWGVHSEGPMYPEKRETRFAQLSWLDFDHPVFFPLRGPQFNDFSNIRFYNHHRLSILEQPARAADEENPRTIARFEPDADGRELPAIVEARAGSGRIVIWAFGADVEWSNLPRSVKFIPLLYETLNWLGGGAEGQRAWLVGERLAPPKGVKGIEVARLPGRTEEVDLSDLEADGTILEARRAGFVRWGAADRAGGPLVEAVNVRSEESNPERIGLEEFELKLCSPKIAPVESVQVDGERRAVIAGFVVQREYWRLLIGLLFAFFFFESWHAAARLRQNRS